MAFSVLFFHMSYPPSPRELLSATGLTKEQLAALVIAQPYLFNVHPEQILTTGTFLKRRLRAEEVVQLLQTDPLLLGSPVWALRETLAKLRLWTEVVGAPLQAVLVEYECCIQQPLLPHLAAAYMLVQVSTAIALVLDW